MECMVCYRQYCLSSTAQQILPKVGTCGHSICHECCELLPNDKNCPYCQQFRSFERQARCFLAEDYLTVIENTDLVGSLLPELKTLIQELEDKKKEFKNDLKKNPTGLFSWLKWKTCKERKALVQLQGKFDCLIDLTTSILRPKLMVPIRRKPFGYLHVEARNLQGLLVDQRIYGPPADIAGCIWSVCLRKRKEGDQYYFCLGVDMETDKDSTKKFHGYGCFNIISQRQNVKDYWYRLDTTFKAPAACKEIKRKWKWENIINDGYVLNNRIFIQCQQWNVKEIVEST